MNKREIFEKVKAHLLAQGKRSMLGDSWNRCRYRGDNGTSCAVGCLIKDEYYEETLEYKGVANIDVLRALRFSGVDVAGDVDTPRMLCKLQEIHDTYLVSDWERMLNNLEKTI